MEVARDAALPFLAPMVALQLLASSPVLPSGRAIAILLMVASGTALMAYGVATLTLSIPGAYFLGMLLLYLWSFALCFIPRFQSAGSLAVTIIVVVSSLATASTGLALGLVGELVLAILGGIALVFFVHAAFPNPPDHAAPAPSLAAEEAARIPPAVRAVLATVIMLPLHLSLTSDGVPAIVVLMTTATLLRQPGVVQIRQYSVAFGLGNLLGGVLATISAFLFHLHGEFLVLVAVTAATSLFLSARIVATDRWGPVFLPGFVTYITLFGLTLSSLPLGAEVAVMPRVLKIVAAAIYVFAAISLFLPLINRVMDTRPLSKKATDTSTT